MYTRNKKMKKKKQNKGKLTRFFNIIYLSISYSFWIFNKLTILNPRNFLTQYTHFLVYYGLILITHYISFWINFCWYCWFWVITFSKYSNFICTEMSLNTTLILQWGRFFRKHNNSKKIKGKDKNLHTLWKYSYQQEHF